MRLLFLGDVYGRPGREAVVSRVPALRAELALDFVVANGENAAGGFGITGEICRQFYGAGVDAITTGNHAWDQKETVAYIGGDPRLLRPQNYPPGTPGRGAAEFRLADGRRVVVIQIMLQLFMPPLSDPFACAEDVLARYPLGRAAEAILLDIHGEASSEKMALAHLVDGRVSVAVGSHTHIPTADVQILPKGTAYQTDAGMCGNYDSVIGLAKRPAIEKFVRKLPAGRIEPEPGEATLCGLFVETDDATGLARRAEPLRLGGKLAPERPSRTPFPK